MPVSKRSRLPLVLPAIVAFGACRLMESADEFSAGGPGIGGTGITGGAAGAGGSSGGAGAGGAQGGAGGTAGSSGGSGGSVSVQCADAPSECADIGANAQAQSRGCCLGTVRFWCEAADTGVKSEDCAQVSRTCDYDQNQQSAACVQGTGGIGGSGGSPGECTECSAACQDCGDPKDGTCETNVQTSPLHCGVCGHSCLGGECLGGNCQPVALATNQAKPWGIAADSDRVYWTLEGTGADSGSVVFKPFAEGAEKVLAPGQAGPASVQTDSTHIFWTTFLGTDSYVWKALKDGTNQEQLASGSAAWSLALDADSVYWTNLGGSVGKVSKAAGSPVTANSAGTPWDVQVDDVSLYWTARDGGEIRKAPKSMTPVSVILTGLKSPLGLAVDDTRVYWVEAGSFAANSCSAPDGAVYSANKDGTGKKPLADKQACPTRLSVLGDSIFWTNAGTTQGGAYKYDGSIMQVKTDGSALRSVAVGQVKPHGIVVTQDRVIWTTQGATSGQGSVMFIRR